jgi:hypothetical protein
MAKKRRKSGRLTGIRLGAPGGAFEFFGPSDIRACACESERDRPPDPSAPAGDNGSLALQQHATNKARTDAE